MSKKNMKRLDKKPAGKKPVAPAKKSNKVLGYLLGTGVVALALGGMALGGGAVMSIFGFEFVSLKDVILFFLAATAISYPLIKIASNFPRLMCVRGVINKPAAMALYVAVGAVVNFFCFFALDRMMENIVATFPALLVVSTLFSLPGVNTVDQRPQ